MATRTNRADAVNLAFFADLVRCETRLYNHFNDELRAAHGIVTSQYEFLLYINTHEEPRTTDIAAALAIGVGAASKAVDRLEARNLLTREPNPANRRSTILRLTDEGRAVIRAADRTFRTRLAGILASAADAEQIATAGSVLTLLRATLEQNGLGTPIG